MHTLTAGLALWILHYSRQVVCMLTFHWPGLYTDPSISSRKPAGRGKRECVRLPLGGRREHEDSLTSGHYVFQRSHNEGFTL